MSNREFVEQVERNLRGIADQRLTKTRVTCEGPEPQDSVLTYVDTAVVHVRRTNELGEAHQRPAVVLASGGWVTATTARRMNQALDGTPFGVARRKDEHFILMRDGKTVTTFARMTIVYGDEEAAA